MEQQSPSTRSPSGRRKHVISRSQHNDRRPCGQGSPADVRRKNRQLIFRLLFPTNQYSRAELGRRTGLSRVAVSDVVGRMLEEGLLRETGQAPSGGKGKRGTLLSIDIDRLRIISIDLTQEHLLHGAVTNLLGQPLRHAEVTLNTRLIRFPWM